MGVSCSSDGLQNVTIAHILNDGVQFVVNVGNYLSYGYLISETKKYKQVFLGYKKQNGFKTLIHQADKHWSLRELELCTQVEPKFCSNKNLELWVNKQRGSVWFARFKDTGEVRMITEMMPSSFDTCSVHVSQDLTRLTIVSQDNQVVQKAELQPGYSVPCYRVQPCKHKVLRYEEYGFTVHADTSAKMFSVIPLTAEPENRSDDEHKFCSATCYNSVSIMQKLPMTRTHFTSNGTLYLRELRFRYSFPNFIDIPFTTVHRIRANSPSLQDNSELLLLDGVNLVLSRYIRRVEYGWHFLKPAPFYVMSSVFLEPVEYYEVQPGQFVVVDREKQIAHKVCPDNFYDMTDKLWLDSRGAQTAPEDTQGLSNVLVLPSGEVVVIPSELADHPSVLLDRSWFLVNVVPLVQPFYVTNRFVPHQDAFFHGSSDVGWFLFDRTGFYFFAGVPTIDSAPSRDVVCVVVADKVFIYHQQYAVIVTPSGCTGLIDQALGDTLVNRGDVDAEHHVIKCKPMANIPLTLVRNQGLVLTHFISV